MGNISTIEALRQTIRAIKSYDKFQLPNNISASTSQIIVMTPLGRYIDGNYTYGLALSEDKWNEMNEYANELSGTEEGEWLKEHLVEENGEKWWTAPYYTKRLSSAAQNRPAAQATSSGPQVGIITTHNKAAKLNKGEITDVFQYEEDHNEFTTQTIMCRDEDGRAVIEDGILPFHIVNKRQLDGSIDEIKTKLSSVYKTTYKSAPQGWYQIAKTTDWDKTNSIWKDTGSGYWNNIFHIRAASANGYVSDITCLVELQNYQSTPTITLLSYNNKGNCLSQIRVINDKNANNSKYLEVYYNRTDNKNLSFTIERLFNDEQYLWKVVEPVLNTNSVPSSNVVLKELDSSKSTIISKINRSSDDINNLATQEYVDSKLSTPSEWDFVLNNEKTLSEDISNAYGKVLIDMSQWEGGGANSYYLTIPETITYIKFNGWCAYSWRISGHNKCTIEGNSFDWGTISDFKEVINCGGAGYEIINCHYVYNSYAASYNNCVYIENCVLDCEPGMAYGGYIASIVDCEHVCHINITENCINGANITDCGVVENVISAVNLTYNNCRYVNPYTCQGYVTQEGAVGKVQMLTADGSFEAVELVGGVDEETSQRITDLENAVYGVEEELTQIYEGGY